MGVRYARLCCWVSKMVILVFGGSKGKALCDWVFQSRDEPRSLGAKIQNTVRETPPDVPRDEDVKSSQRDNRKIPDIFFSMPGSPLNSTLYTGRTVYCYWLFHVLINHHHHHHVMPLARISLNLSRHFSLSFIAYGWSSGLHPASSQSCCMYVRAGHPAFARLYVGLHRNISIMSSSLLLQQCPACLVRLTWIVLMMGGRWPYSWCFVGCCRQDLFNIARNILV